MRSSCLSSLLLAAGLAAASPSAPAAEVEFLFNGASEPRNTGSARAVSADWFDAQNAPADLRSLDATGVSGRPGDRAFDNLAASNRMGFAPATDGESSQGGRLEITGLEQLLSGSSAFTVTFWLRSEEKIGANARLLDLAFQPLPKSNPSSSGGGLSLRATSDKAAGRLALDIFTEKDGLMERAYQASARDVVPAGDWVFLAIVFQGAVDSSSVTVYRGAASEDPSSILELPIPPGSLSINSQGRSVLGNAPGSVTAPGRAFFDNLRLFPAALTPSQLDAIRRADLDNAPPKL